MKKTIIGLFIIFFSCLMLNAQSYSLRSGKCGDKSNFCPKIALFHETAYNFGSLGVNSVNIDIILMCNKYYMASLRTGINYFSFPKIYSAGVPLELNFMLGRGSWLFELGLGVNYLYFYKNYTHDAGRFSDNVSYLAATGRIGVRYERINGLFFRAGYNPYCSLIGYHNIEPISKHPFLHMLSAGIGYTFNN